MVGGIIFFVVVVGGIASAFLLFYRRAVKDSRRIGAPSARRTATFRGGMWRPDRFNAGPGTVSLKFFDWGIRLGSSGAANWAGMGLAKLMTPVWEARYEELTEARLVTAPTHQGIRLRAGDGEGEVFFWTRQGSEVLDRLEEHVVHVDRAADQVPDPPPISTSGSGVGSVGGG
jgi:hypothetical protein